MRCHLRKKHTLIRTNRVPTNSVHNFQCHSKAGENSIISVYIFIKFRHFLVNIS